MSDSDDSEEYKPDLSEEAKAIEFEWTPELVSIRIADGSIHPLAGPLEMHDGLPTYNLGPDVALPDPSDTPECLKWMGLSEKKTTELMQNFNALDSNYQAPVHGYDEKFSSNGKNGITFPLLDKLSNLFLEELPYSDDYEYTHEGYIKRAIQLGLRPEFAIFCGLHETNPRAIEDPSLYKKRWFKQGPEDRIRNHLSETWLQLQMFMKLKLVRDGKAWMDLHGDWLVHEGENIDQAKSRVDDTERQRLLVGGEGNGRAETSNG